MPMIGLLTSLLQLLVSQGHTVGGLSTPIRLYADGPLMPAKPESSP
jgi:hypothetical protein